MARYSYCLTVRQLPAGGVVLDGGARVAVTGFGYQIQVQKFVCHEVSYAVVGYFLHGRYDPRTCFHLGEIAVDLAFIPFGYRNEDDGLLAVDFLGGRQHDPVNADKGAAVCQAPYAARKNHRTS
ncbi:hypothetical protein [Mesorhizobium sp. L103C105A0]|uniref:hypothetical protein n=1 Tax=Mesorhizobium sp. L103C105A0 TaxID=1287074 RepID=UPI0003CFC547|nr:hypothetical protein [Mesorhizobium sp. L103C105A0]ESZ74412.1 hypothetical protein X726_22405 [Mesorhizobium sp. L103C105A0]